LENIKTDTTFQKRGFTVVSSRKNQEIFLGKTLYATVSNIPQSAAFSENSEDIIPLFEVRCIEKKSDLFGALIIFENRTERWKRIMTIEKD